MLTIALAGAAPALAHDGVVHGTEAEAAAHAAAPGPALPFPVDIRARFALLDHRGRAVTDADFAGRPWVAFFGYASCQQICSVALPNLGAALDILGKRAEGLAALMITVDPARDTPETMAGALAKWHPRLLGLTGTDAALAAARAAFQVESSLVFEDPDAGSVFAHGSFIYLVGADGRVATILPPILAPERMAEIIAAYL